MATIYTVDSLDNIDLKTQTGLVRMSASDFKDPSIKYFSDSYYIGDTIPGTNCVVDSFKFVERSDEADRMSVVLKEYGNGAKIWLGEGHSFKFEGSISLDITPPYSDTYKKHITKAVKQYANKEFKEGNETLLQIVPSISTDEERSIFCELIERTYGIRIDLSDLMSYMEEGGDSFKIKEFFDMISEMPEGIKHIFFDIDIHPWHDYNELLDPKDNDE